VPVRSGERIEAMTNEQLRERAENLIREKRMPSIEKLSSAILEMRRKYAAQIRMARREAKEATRENKTQ
jgi:hypothetical protein